MWQDSGFVNQGGAEGWAVRSLGAAPHDLRLHGVLRTTPGSGLHPLLPQAPPAPLPAHLSLVSVPVLVPLILSSVTLSCLFSSPAASGSVSIRDTEVGLFGVGE